MFRARLVPAPAEVIGWVGSLPGPVAVVYESGPTGFGLARALTAAGVRCRVAASSKLQRPGGPGQDRRPGCVAPGPAAAAG